MLRPEISKNDISHCIFVFSVDTDGNSNRISSDIIVSLYPFLVAKFCSPKHRNLCLQKYEVFMKFAALKNFDEVPGTADTKCFFIKCIHNIFE